jgi:glycosyltransferase involved in cell wall biosynthesis
MEDLTVIIPAKDEPDSLPSVIKEIRDLKLNYFIIVEKNDLKTINVIDDKKNILYQTNQGFGDSIILGINKVKTKYFSIIFADGSTNPNELSLLANHLKKTDSDFVFGSRYSKNASSEDDTITTYFGNKIFSLLGKLFFGLKISDILFTYVFGKTDKARNLNLKSRDFGICVELPIFANKLGYKITDYPCHERQRLYGKKKINALIDGYKILIKMLKIYINK